MVTVEASSRPGMGLSRSSLMEVRPNSSIEDRYTGMRSHHYPSSHRPSMISNLSSNLTSTLANNSRSRSHSKAESISTLWSSAEVPLFLDTSMQRCESLGSHSSAGPSKMMTSFVPTRSSSNDFQISADNHAHQEEISDVSILINGPRSVSSPRSSDVGQYGTPRRDSHRQQMRPPPLNLHRESKTHPTSVPVSISQSSTHIVQPLQSNVNIINSSKEASTSPPSHLYQHAEKFFSLSYTMTPPSSADSSKNVFTEEDTSQQSPIKVLSPSNSYSRDSRSSTDSSSALPDCDSYNNRLCAISAVTKSTSHDGISSSPLRVAQGLTADQPNSRPHSSLATLAAESPRTRSSATLMTFRTSEQEALRLGKEVEEIKYSFLDSPAPLISGRKSSMSMKKMSLFNARMKTSSTPKLNSEKQQENAYSQEVEKVQQREGNRSYPPQSPSGRFRSRTLGESELSESVQSASVSHNITPRTSQDNTSQRPSRRPSSSEAFSAMAARLRRPSKTATIASSHYNSSVTSVNEVYEMGPSRVDRAFSTASSQHCTESGRNTSMSTFLKKAATSTPAQTKSKGGWASHLTQGLTLHIEQGSKKYTIRMNYLSYDPFGKPESLCKDRPMTPMRPKSKSGISQEDETSSNESVGLLEFDPRIETEGSTTADRLTFDAITDAPILKHLVIGDDIKGDLITRQANLSLSNVGTREVSGSERKGKVTWRFVYGVEDCRLDSGEIVAGMKTLRPLSFTCSATLLDPSRAKKSRVINIIRKQIGSNIESMPMPSSARSASVTSSTYLQSLPTLASPTSSQSSSQQQSPSRCTYSPMTASNPALSPTRERLTPFKLTRPVLEAMRYRTNGGEQLSPSMNTAPSSPRGTSSFLTRNSSQLPSPLSCNFQVDSRSHQRSPSAYAAGGRLLAPHQIKTRPRGSSVGKEPISALGLDLGDVASTPRRVRPSTSQGELKRPTTASEEIKHAYLMQSSVQHLNTLPNPHIMAQQSFNASEVLDNSPPSRKQSLNHHHHHQTSHQSRRPSNTNQAIINDNSNSHHHTTITTARQQPVSPVIASKHKRQVKTNFIQTPGGPPEGPFWL